MTTAPATIPPLTPADVERLSDEHGKLYELVHGVLAEKPAMGFRSNEVASQLVFLLKSVFQRDRAYVVQEQPTYCFTDPAHMRRPDVLLVWTTRVPQGTTHGELQIPPDFVAEVVSPSNTWMEIRARVEEYLGAGVPLVWVVEPDQRSVQAYRKDGSVALYRANDTIRNEPLLPGLSLPVTDIFPAVDPARSGT